MGLLKIERHANKIYMTDEFFYKHKNFVGGVLAFLSFYIFTSNFLGNKLNTITSLPTNG
jgi:hypothetical protein